jgi:Heparinase II/III-like protein/Heparinase II/III N-terminus
MLKNNWYFNRLTTMSAGEIFYRIKKQLSLYLEERSLNRSVVSSHGIKSKGDILGIRVPDLKIVPDSLKIFGKDFGYGSPEGINWHRDIFSGESFSLAFYSKINIRENPLLSAKCVWEINRLQFLTAICMNYAVSGNDSYLDLFMKINRSWDLQNPWLRGVNWYSNIEINLRLITWFLCWEILDAEALKANNPGFSDFTGKTWLPLIEKHCLYSYKNPSKYSSANNHLISEYAGLFLASSRWTFRDSEKWIVYSQKGLEEEIIKQHSAEGINREEAAEYIQFITDFFLLSFITGERTNRPFSERFRERLYKIFCYINEFLDAGGNFPRYGDEDDGKCFILDFDEGFNNFKSLLTSGAIIFRDEALKRGGNGFDLKNRILFGEKGRIVFDSIPDAGTGRSSKFYKGEGHFIFRKEQGEREIYMHFDAAPLGYLSIAAHGHADALSFLLTINGQPLFIDPGTYTYHTEPEWRQYFIGTLAHNTARIEEKNQAVNGGPTLWIKHYDIDIHDVESDTGRERVKASHNGYLSDGAIHQREIIFDRVLNEFLINDTIIVKGKRRLRVEFPFHIHPGITIEKKAKNLFLLSKDQLPGTEFQIDEKLEPVIVRGETGDSLLGWYSGSFLKKEPTGVIYCKTTVDSTTSFKFIIKINQYEY